MAAHSVSLVSDSGCFKEVIGLHIFDTWFRTCQDSRFLSGIFCLVEAVEVHDNYRLVCFLNLWCRFCVGFIVIRLIFYVVLLYVLRLLKCLFVWSFVDIFGVDVLYTVQADGNGVNEDLQVMHIFTHKLVLHERFVRPWEVGIKFYQDIPAFECLPLVRNGTFCACSTRLLVQASERFSIK